jgi:hypothetical protein
VRKDLLGIIKQVFAHLWHLWFWRFLKVLFIFQVFHFLFGKYSEPREQILKRTPQGTFLQKISFLGIIVSEKMFKEKLMLDAYADEMPWHKVRMNFILTQNKYGHKRDYAHPTMIHPPQPTLAHTANYACS